MPSPFTTHVRNLLRAGYPALYVTTHEETRGLNDLQDVARKTNLAFRVWSCTEGLIDPGNNTTEDVRDPYALLQAVGSLTDTLVVLRDLHLA